jgi:hypothetical protein
MNKFISVILSAALLFAIPVVFNAPPFGGGAAIAAADEKYPKDANGMFLVPENFKDPIASLSDAAFFDLFDYSGYPALASVESAAKSGDFTSAKANLLEYYRGVEQRRARTPVSSVSKQQRVLADLLQYNFIRNSNSSIRFVDTFTVNSALKEIRIDLTDSISSLLSSPKQTPVLQIMAVSKDGKRARIASRSIAGMEPRIEMLINGSAVTIPATEDSTVRAGINRATVYKEDYLYAAESMTTIKKVTEADKAVEDWYSTDAADENTERPIIKFDMSGVNAANTITAPVLKLYAQTLDNAGDKKLIVLGINDNLWNENDICWDSYEHAMVCYDGEPYIRQGGYFFNGFSRRYRDELQRLIGYVDYAAAMYRYVSSSADKDKWGRILLTQLCGYLDQLGDADPLAYRNSASSDPSNPYACSTYGRNNLDIGSRMSNMINLFHYGIDSIHMTPEIWTSFMKLTYLSAQWLALKENWNNTNNWGSFETSGLAFSVMSFPEFRHRDELRQVVDDRIYTPHYVGDDMGCVEVPIGYAVTMLGSIYGLKNQANEIGAEDGFGPEVIAQISDLSRYIYYSSMPGGLNSQQGNGAGYDQSVTVTPAKVGNDYKIPEILWFTTNGKSGVKPAFTSHYYPSNAKFIMRNGWGNRDLWFQTNIDGGYDNHGHEDDLSVMVHAYGKYLIADPSYDGLDYEKPSTVWLNSTNAHNTITINGKTQNKDKKLGTLNEWVTNDSYDFFSGTTTKNPDGKHTRSVLFIRDGYWIVSDYVEPVNQTAQNDVRQLWHVLPTANVSLNPADNSSRTNFEDVNIHIVPAAGRNITGSIKPGYFGGGTNVLTNADYIEYNQKETGNVAYTTLLVPEDTGAQKSVTHTELPLEGITKNGVSATKINISDRNILTDAAYYAVHDLNQTAVRAFGDFETNGTMTYIEKENGNLNKIYAKDANENPAGIEIKDKSIDTVLLKSTKALPNIAVTQKSGVINIYTDNDVNPKANTSVTSPIDLTSLTVYAPGNISIVRLNGRQTAFKKSGSHIYFGSRPIIEEPSGGTPPQSDNGGIKPPPHGGGGGSGGNGGGALPGHSGDGGETGEIHDRPGKEAVLNEIYGHWASEEIAALVEQGIVIGDNGSLRLSDAVTRAEFITMLVRMADIRLIEYAGEFADVSAGDWYADYMAAAKAHGFLDGSGGNAMPNEILTREEMAKFLICVYETEFGEIIPGAVTFDDEGEISGWAYKYVAKAVAEGLMNGTGAGMFSPGEPAFREQAMAVLGRMLKKK